MTLAETVRAELLAVRKSPNALTVTAMAGCTTACALLGGGDPALAYNQLKTRLLDWEPSLALSAAMASLGLTSSARSHLARLTDFGEKHGYDQRQVRRYSDRGIREIATLVTTRWSDAGTPSLNLSVFQPSESRLEMHLVASYLAVVEMRNIAIRVRQGCEESAFDALVHAKSEGAYIVLQSESPIVVTAVPEGTSVTIVWNGELWPKYMVCVGQSPSSDLAIEMLGAKVMIRL